MSKLNILYWNTHYGAGIYKINKKQYEKNLCFSTKIICGQISNAINDIGEIEAVVMTEGLYGLKELIDKSIENMDEKSEEDEKLLKKNYDKFVKDKYNIFVNDEGIKENPVIIMALKSKKYNIVSKGRRYLHVKNKDGINIIGYRTFWDKEKVHIWNLLKELIYNDLACINEKFDENILNDIKKEVEKLSLKTNGKNNNIICRHIEEELENDKIEYINIKKYFNELKKINLGNKNIYRAILDSKSQEENREIIYSVQISEMFKYIENNINANERIIMLGDFNFDIKNEELYKLFANKLKECDDYTIGDRKLDWLYINNKCIKSKFSVYKKMKELYFAKSGEKYIDDAIEQIVNINSPFPDHNLLFASIDLGDD